MSSARAALGRRQVVINLQASRRISTKLLSNAKNGPSGKAATNIVINPNWITDKNRIKSITKFEVAILLKYLSFISPPSIHHRNITYPSPSTHRTMHFQVLVSNSHLIATATVMQEDLDLQWFLHPEISLLYSLAVSTNLLVLFKKLNKYKIRLSLDTYIMHTLHQQKVAQI